jgi:ectoine hydroxylase-related dioxygenase (phytanoyl-CoA dioxygenase family)
MSAPMIDDRDWSLLSRPQQIQQLEVEGYLVLPDLLDPEQLIRLKAATARLTTTAVDYSEHQQVAGNVQFASPEITRLIGHPTATEFLLDLFGDEIVMMTYAYARSEPGHPGISLHTDGQPYGSEIFGYEGSCPVLVRVLYYLDDLTPDVSPFRVVPRSHLSLHAEANPYLRYQSHPEEVMVTARAGSAVLIHPRVFHGNFPNRGNRSRELLAIAYRPAWAGPVAEVDEWDPTELEDIEPQVRAYLGSRNQRQGDLHGGNKPDNMPDQADGLSPSRWSCRPR